MKRKIVIVIALFLFVLPFMTEDFNLQQQITIGTLGGVLVLWFTGVISYTIVGGIIILALVGGGVLQLSLLIDILFSDIVYLLLGIFIIVEAIKNSNIPIKIINIALKYMGGNIIKLLYFSPLYLLLIIPGPISRITISLPLIEQIKDQLDFEHSNIRSLFSLLYIVIPYVGLASASIYPLAAPSRLLAYHILNNNQEIDLSFLEWFFISGPVILIFVIILYFIIKLVKIKEWRELEKKVVSLRHMMDSKLDKSDKRLVYLLVIVFFLFFSRGFLHNIGLGIIAISFSLVLFTPIVDFFSPGDFVKICNYQIIILYISSLLLAKALESSGLIKMFTDYILSYQILYNHKFYSLLFFSLILFLVRIVFVSNTASLTIFLPIALSFARELGIGMTWAGMFFLLSFSVTFVLPISWPGYLIFWQEGEYSLSRHIKWGIVVSFIYLITLYLAAFYYWPIIGIRF